MTNQVNYLTVYENKSILFDGNQTYTYTEGRTSATAIQRTTNLKQRLDEGFLVNIIGECRNPHILVGKNIAEEHLTLLKGLVEYTSEVGRALVGLTILQLCIKSIEPEQSIRLHKSSNNRGSFSWTEGVSMRVLDKNFITPVLRENELLKLNADGFMMTRSLAENYPYSKLYKAAIKGAKKEWLEIVDLLEANLLNAKNALYHLISLLINKSDAFKKLADETLSLLDRYLQMEPNVEEINNLITGFVDSSSYSARIFEVALHSLYQVRDELKLLPGTLKNLTQMRSANKKHGNIGDVEVVSASNDSFIMEAWDAKYGKPYLRDELEEISDKLRIHPETELVGFVVNDTPNLKSEILERMEELEEEYEVEVKILSFEEWISYQITEFEQEGYSKNSVMKRWIKAFVETLCQERREIAPLDEPCDNWVLEINRLLQEKIG